MSKSKPNAIAQCATCSHWDVTNAEGTMPPHNGNAGHYCAGSLKMPQATYTVLDGRSLAATRYRGRR